MTNLPTTKNDRIPDLGTLENTKVSCPICGVVPCICVLSNLEPKENDLMGMTPPRSTRGSKRKAPHPTQTPPECSTRNPTESPTVNKLPKLSKLPTPPQRTWELKESMETPAKRVCRAVVSRDSQTIRVTQFPSPTVHPVSMSSMNPLSSPVNQFPSSPFPISPAPESPIKLRNEIHELAGNTFIKKNSVQEQQKQHISREGTFIKKENSFFLFFYDKMEEQTKNGLRTDTGKLAADGRAEQGQGRLESPPEETEKPSKSPHPWCSQGHQP